MLGSLNKTKLAKTPMFQNDAKCYMGDKGAVAYSAESIFMFSGPTCSVKFPRSTEADK